MLKKIVATCVLGVFFLGFGAQKASALEYSSNEKIKTLTIHEGGGIYFQTSFTCQNWCQINPLKSAEVQKYQYATLLAAKTSGLSVTLEWNTPLKADKTAEIYQRPSYIMLTD